MRYVPTALALLLFALPSCISSGETVKASEIKPVVDAICERHDAYVNADTNASELEKRTWLRSTEILRGTVDQAAAGGSAPAQEE